MVLCCCAPGCRNQKNVGSPIKFYQFPLDRIVVGCSGSPQFVSKALYQLTHIGFAALISYQVSLLHRIKDVLSHSCSLLGQMSLDPLHPDFVLSIFDHLDCRSKEKLKRKLDRYLQTTETKRKRSASIACTAMGKEKDKSCMDG